MLSFRTIQPGTFKAQTYFYSTSSLLSVLRKKTGISIANCRKALEINGNDLVKAEAWLTSQAQANGWEKVAKLQNRVTRHGLVGVLCDGRLGVMLEVNCETDFVSRNETFRELVSYCTSSLYTKCSSQPTGNPSKLSFNKELLNQLEASNEDKKLMDYLAFHIGKIGENIVLRRGVSIQANFPTHKVAAAIHPKMSDSTILTGKYGTLMLYEEKLRSTTACSNIVSESSDFPRLVCQHIIGMNPKCIKTPTTDFGKGNFSEEDILYHQEFVSNPDYTVGEAVEQLNCEILDFVRFECGEVI